MQMNFRLIGKLGFLLVFIGFFMPMACDMNAFELVDNRMLRDEGVFGIYTVFISAIAGLLIGVLLLAKNKVPVYIDWAVTLVCSITTIIMFCYIGYKQDRHESFQSGVYFVLIGSIVALLAQIISSYQHSPVSAGEQQNGTVKADPPDIPAHDFSATHTVVKETNLNDSLCLKPKTYRTLTIGEKVSVQNTVDRSMDLGGTWAFVETEKEDGWCLLDALSKIERGGAVAPF
jgi:hypothetical protein